MSTLEFPPQVWRAFVIAFMSAAAVIAFLSIVQAQPRPGVCQSPLVPYEQAVGSLKSRYGESPRLVMAVGLGRPTIVEFWAAPHTDGTFTATWTLILRNGLMACQIGAGEAYQWVGDVEAVVPGSDA